AAYPDGKNKPKTPLAQKKIIFRLDAVLFRFTASGFRPAGFHLQVSRGRFSFVFIMKASTERKILGWTHLILSIPILGAVYGQIPTEAGVNAVRFVFLPVVVLSGLWMWKGHWIRKWWKRNKSPRQVGKKNYL